MKHIPSRDITGRCEGDCIDLVYRSEQQNQECIDAYEYSSGPTPSVPWARNRDEQPGFFGGHV